MTIVPFARGRSVRVGALVACGALALLAPGGLAQTPENQATPVAGAQDGDGPHPAHIHTGTCDDFDPDPTFPLATVILDEVSDEGVSATAVDAVSLDALLADDYVILVHPSAEELFPEWVCGDIKVSAAVGGAPAVGVGAAFAADDTVPSPAVLGALAVLAAVFGAFDWLGARLLAPLGLLLLLLVVAAGGALLRV